MPDQARWPYASTSDYAVTAEHQRVIQHAIMQDIDDPFVLIDQAGKAALHLALKLWPSIKHWLVMVGNGNNGNDGLSFAIQAARLGHRVHVGMLKQQLNDQQYILCQKAQVSGVIFHDITEKSEIFDIFTTPYVMIDALIGIGIGGKITDMMAKIIDRMNNHHAEILSLDLPSGICPNTGIVYGCHAVMATHTHWYYYA